LVAFAGACDAGAPGSPVAKLCEFLSESPLKRFTAAGADVDSVIDVRAVFQQSHHTLAITALPGLLFPSKGRYGLQDYEKAFCALTDVAQDIYAMRGIDRDKGCLVVVRPDQYIAQVLPLNDTAALADFFAGFMLSAIN
jgi:phenol 2-monooxygenase (NADPH)